MVKIHRGHDREAETDISLLIIAPGTMHKSEPCTNRPDRSAVTAPPAKIGREGFTRLRNSVWLIDRCRGAQRCEQSHIDGKSNGLGDPTCCDESVPVLRCR